MKLPQRVCSLSTSWNSGNSKWKLICWKSKSFSGPVRSLYSNFSVSLLIFHSKLIPNSFTNFSYPAICLYLFWQNPFEKVDTLSMASFLRSSLIRSSIKLSDILKNKCSVSIIIWSIGIKSNNGLVLQLYCLDFAYLPISCESLAQRDLSVIDHFLLMNLSFLGHLHQIQAKFWFAALRPQTQARNFQSPPKKILSAILMTIYSYFF